MSVSKQNISFETRSKMKNKKAIYFKKVINTITFEEYESIMDCVRKTGWSKGKVQYKLKINKDLKFKT